jgi:hypothetical protein
MRIEMNGETRRTGYQNAYCRRAFMVVDYNKVIQTVFET